MLNYLCRKDQFDGVKLLTGAIASAPLVTLTTPLSAYKFYPLKILSYITPSFVTNIELDPKFMSHDEVQVEKYKNDVLIHGFSTLATGTCPTLFHHEIFTRVFQPEDFWLLVYPCLPWAPRLIHQSYFHMARLTPSTIIQARKKCMRLYPAKTRPWRAGKVSTMNVRLLGWDHGWITYFKYTTRDSQRENKLHKSILNGSWHGSLRRSRVKEEIRLPTSCSSIWSEQHWSTLFLSGIPWSLLCNVVDS